MTTTPLSKSEETPHVNERTCTCKFHKMKRFERVVLGFSPVGFYSSTPKGGWKLHALLDEKYAWPAPYFLGVELETDRYFRNPLDGEVYSELDPEQAADLAEPKNFWHPKSDSSVTGPEFASHPATLAWWRKHKPSLTRMFKTLIHSGYRSYDNDTCGMHINISRSAFRDGKHMFRLLTLLHANTAWTMRMSQRTAASAKHWAKLSEGKTPQQRHALCTQMFSKGAPMDPEIGEGYSNRCGGTDDRYLAMNAPYEQPRFEFRLPRGTLRVDRFFKNLEWLVAMVEYTRTALVEDCTPAKFTAWVEADPKAYPFLLAFMVEKADRLQRAIQLGSVVKAVRTVPPLRPRSQMRYIHQPYWLDGRELTELEARRLNDDDFYRLETESASHYSDIRREERLRREAERAAQPSDYWLDGRNLTNGDGQPSGFYLYGLSLSNAEFSRLTMSQYVRAVRETQERQAAQAAERLTEAVRATTAFVDDLTAATVEAAESIRASVRPSYWEDGVLVMPDDVRSVEFELLPLNTVA